MRYFSGKYSGKDYRLVHDQFSGIQNQQQLKQLLKQHWMAYETEQDADGDELDELLHRLQHRIYLEENGKQVRLSQLYRLQRIAAVLFIPLLLVFMTYLFLDHRGSEVDAYAEIRSPRSGKTYFVLPDGSSGFLNNGSVLKYPVAFQNNRIVDLAGEACFDVVHSGSPFHVLTRMLNVKVMGTKFNVIAYPEDHSEAIILECGKVKVFSKSGKELAVLNPDQQLVLDPESKKIQLKKVDASQYTAWTEGKLIFRNERLDDVVRRLSRWYNVDFVIGDPELLDYTFHATFIDERLDEVLKLLSLTTPITYEEEKRKQSAAGELLGRRKIRLKLDHEKINMFK